MRKSTTAFELTKTKYEFTILTMVHTYHHGSGFGELALLSKKTSKRSATL
jgi:hypothetical protein